MKFLRIILPSILILIVTFIAFAPCLKNGFVNWDDDAYVRENPAIQEASLANIKKIFTGFFVGNYQPLVMLTYLTEYHFFKLNPQPYHAINLMLHLLNTLLVFWLISILAGRMIVAFIAAILFGVHPIHVESVVWVSELKDVLYSAFFLLSLLCYCYYLRTRKLGRGYFLSVGFFFLSLLSKAMAITLPGILFLMDYAFGRKPDRHGLTDKVPFFLLAAVFGLVAVWGQHSGGGISEKDMLDFSRVIFVPCGAIIFYIGKIFFPVGLSSLYPVAETKNLYSLGLCIGMSCILIFSMKYTKKIALGGLFFLIVLLPVLQFIPNGYLTVADRYSYMASVGVFFVFAEVAVWLYGKIPKERKLFWSVAVIILGLFLVGVLSVQTRNQCKIWKDSMSLWNDVLSKNSKAHIAYNNRGLVWQDRKEFEKARYDFERAIFYAPQDEIPFVSLGSLYLEMGKNDDAIAVYQKKLRLTPRSIPANFQLGSIYETLGRNDEAIAFFLKTIEIQEKFLMGYFRLGLLYKKLNRTDESIRAFKKALALDPKSLFCYVALLDLYDQLGKSDEKVNVYRMIVANDLDFFDAYYELGNLWMQKGSVGKAMPMYERAVKIDPSSAEASASLGEAYCRIGKNKEAIVWLEKALEIDPKLAVAHNNIAVAFYYLKRYDSAIYHSDKAIKLGYKLDPKLMELLKPYRRQQKKRNLN